MGARAVGAWGLFECLSRGSRARVKALCSCVNEAYDTFIKFVNACSPLRNEPMSKKDVVIPLVPAALSALLLAGGVTVF